MTVATYTKTGAKAATPAKLNKDIFGLSVSNHELLKEAYLAYLANGRANLAVTKRRGEVSGGGRKPWRQKGTGRARVGSSRNPLWRGGGIAFGPTGEENYTRRMSTASRRQALRQALSLASASDKLLIIDDFAPVGGKTKAAAALLTKLGAGKNTLLVLGDASASKAARNLGDVKLVYAKTLHAYHVLNADKVVVTKPALELLEARLGGKQ